MLDILGRAKWSVCRETRPHAQLADHLHAPRDAWNKRKGVSEDDAKRHYVEGLVKVFRAPFAPRIGPSH